MNCQSGPCIVCLTGTDTALAFSGSLEWLAGGLHVLGVPTREAILTVEAATVHINDEGRAQITYRVCRPCAKRNAPTLPTPALVHIGAQIPCVTQPAVSHG